MPLFLGAAVLVVFALLSLSASEGPEGRKRAEGTILGALTVGAVVFVLAKAGLGWVGLGLALLWGAAKRFASEDSSGKATPRAKPSVRPPAVAAPMNEDEALAVLGLARGATKEQILAEYRRLMKKVHPDQGGTTYLATRLNQAKDVLLGA